MKKCLFLFFIIYFCFNFNVLMGVDIGSDTAVNRFNTQQVLNDGDRVAGFAALQGGFRLDSPAVTATFDSFFPVSGTLELNLGNLMLGRDLVLSEVKSFVSLGHIHGAGHILRMSLGNENIFPFFDDVSFCQIIALWTSANIGQPTCFDWSPDDKFIAIGFTGTKSIDIYEFDGSSLTLRGAVAGGREVTDIKWHPTESYRLAVTTLKDPGAGPEILIYAVSAVGVPTLTSSANPNVNVFAVDWHYTGSWIAVGENTGGSELSIYAVSGTGIINGTPVATASPGTVSDRAVSWYSGEDYLAVGVTSAAANELVVYSFNQVTPALTLEASSAIGYDVNAVDWNLTTTYYALAVGLEAAAPEVLGVYEFDPVGGSITRLTYAIIDKGVEAVDWNSQCGECLAVGIDQGSSGGEFKTYDYDTENPSLTISSESMAAASTVYDVGWSNDGAYVAHLGSNFIYLYSRVINAGGVLFDDLHIILDGNYEVQEGLEMRFSGSCSFDGLGHCLMLNDNTSIVIESDSHLSLQNIKIHNVSGNNIRCYSDTSTLRLKDVQWFLDGDYTFTTGMFEVACQDFHILGEGFGFGYKSDLESIIGSDGRMILDRNVTFSYDPPIADRDLLSMADSTSELVLRGATLFSTSTGLRLTKGNLVVERKSFISCDGDVLSEAVSFGDGSSASNNLSVQCVGAANLEILGGYVVDNTVSS
ncbi:hypothetical protein ACFLYU_01290 [Candidatus Dependentiae bacterium]